MIKISADQVGVAPAEVTPEHHYFNDLEYDSLDVVEVGMAMEDEFGISVADEEVQNLQTVGQAIDLVERLLNEKSQSTQAQPSMTQP